MSYIGQSAELEEALVPNVVVESPMQYLDKATGTLRELGLLPAKVEDAPINALLQKISDLDQDRIAIIARTLGQSGVFNEVVREQTQAVEIGGAIGRSRKASTRSAMMPRRWSTSSRMPRSIYGSASPTFG
jgi:hypothetical protein